METTHDIIQAGYTAAHERAMAEMFSSGHEGEVLQALVNARTEAPLAAARAAVMSNFAETGNVSRQGEAVMQCTGGYEIVTDGFGHQSMCDPDAIPAGHISH